MKIEKTKEFIKEYEKLPVRIQSLYKKQEKIFISDWLDSRLHIKRIKEMKGVYSFRITRKYRVLFYFSKEIAIFFAIGHKKIYMEIKKGNLLYFYPTILSILFFLKKYKKIL